MGGPEQLAKAAGALAGLGLAIAAAAPFTGVPPRGVSGARLAPAQLEVRVQAAGEFTVSPVGTVMKPTAFPAPGERGGPTLAISLRNITGNTMRVAVRLLPIAPDLDKVMTVRGSVGGAVILRGGIERYGDWTVPAGAIRSGETSTLRIRFKLRKGLDADAFAGRLDIRQLEFKGAGIGQPLDVPDDQPKVVPGTEGTTPPTTPFATGTPTLVPTPSGTATPDPGAPKRLAPDEGSE